GEQSRDLSRARFPCPSFIDSDYPCKTASSHKSLVIPTTKGGVTMMTGVNIKKTGAVLLLLLALGTIIASLSVNNSFSMPGAVIIVFFSILIAFLFWTDDRERKV
ncbi:hypothetical protein ACTNDP_22150, partial [Paenibacillus barengoltzii]|uniref:hypothetical protein n=1 Tax=Paenibacillus barengoltzii TaxID=343517 RepID=UPI003F8B0161